MGDTKSLISRRDMLRATAFTAGAVAFATREAGAQDTVPRFRIGACDWSLGKQSDVGAFAVAKELGLDGVQVSLGTEADDMHLRQPSVQQAFLEEAARQDVAIASLAIGELNRIPYKSDPRTEEWVRDSIDVCTALDVNVVLFAFFGDGDLIDDPQGVDTVVERLKRVAPKAEEAGVYLAIESWLSGPQHLEIIERVGSPNVKVYYDLGNSHLRGYDIYQEIRDLGTEHICEFHAKDYEFIFGQGKVDFVEARKAMDDIGYSGWIQIEGAKPLGLMESYTADCKYLRSVFPPAG
jgi:sugar phosphate isomerase/epimerase